MIYKRKKAFGQALIIQLFLYLTENLIFLAVNDPHAHLIISIPLTLTVYILPVMFYRKRTGYTPFFSPLFPETDNNKNEKYNVAKKALIFFSALSVTVTAVNIFGLLGDRILLFFGFQRTPAPTSPDFFTLSVTFLKSVLIAAFCEEILFRGVMLHAFGQSSMNKAVLISAGLFALMHYNLSQTLYAFAAGAVIAYCAFKTRSLAFAFALHFGSNFITYIFTVLQFYLPQPLYNRISLITASAFAAITLFSVIVIILKTLKARRTPDTERRAKTVNGSDSAPPCPEIAAYALFAFVLCILNLA